MPVEKQASYPQYIDRMRNLRNLRKISAMATTTDDKIKKGELLKIRDLCNEFGFKPSTLYSMVSRGKIRSVKLPGKGLFVYKNEIVKPL